MASRRRTTREATGIYALGKFLEGFNSGKEKADERNQKLSELTAKRLLEEEDRKINRASKAADIFAKSKETVTEVPDKTSPTGYREIRTRGLTPNQEKALLSEIGYKNGALPGLLSDEGEVMPGAYKRYTSPASDEIPTTITRAEFDKDPGRWRNVPGLRVLENPKTGSVAGTPAQKKALSTYNALFKKNLENDGLSKSDADLLVQTAQFLDPNAPIKATPPTKGENALSLIKNFSKAKWKIEGPPLDETVFENTSTAPAPVGSTPQPNTSADLPIAAIEKIKAAAGAVVEFGNRRKFQWKNNQVIEVQ